MPISPTGGTVTDEHIAILRAFWTGATSELRDTRYSVAGLRMEPASIQRPHPPHLDGRNQPAGPAPRRPAGRRLARRPPVAR